MALPKLTNKDHIRFLRLNLMTIEGIAIGLDGQEENTTRQRRLFNLIDDCRTLIRHIEENPESMENQSE